MTFFYDLNKKLDEIRATPELTHTQLNERDMSRAAKGYEKYGKQGMEALAKAGREGKSLDPIRKKYDKYDETVEEGAYQGGPDKSQIPAVNRPGNKLTTADLEKERTQSPTSAEGMRALQDKLSKINPMDEADMEEGNRFSKAVVDAKADGIQPGEKIKVGGKEYPVRESANDKKPCPPMSHVKKMCQDGKTVAEICKMHPDCDQTELKQMVADCKKTLDEASMPMKKVNGKSVPAFAADGKGKNDLRGKKPAQTTESIKLIAVKEGADQTVKVYCDTAYDEFHVRVFSKGQEVVESRYFTQSQDDAISTADYMVEGAFTMTPKQKSFAKLAPPANKITFADKIAGAKKEVDEMLGDVAAEAMKKALGGGMGRSAEMEEKEDLSPFTNYKKPRADKPKVGSTERGALHDIEHTATGRKVTRRVDPNTGHSVGTDDSKSASGDKPKRKAGRPDGQGPGKRIGAKGPSGKSKLMTREGDLEEAASFSGSELQKAWQLATGLKSFISDPQGREVWNDLIKLLKYKLSQGAQPVEEKAPPGEKAERMVKGIKKSLSKDGNLSGKDKAIAYATTWKAKKSGKVEEESTDKEDQHAEKAGKKVAKDIEHDEDHKGHDDNRAEKAGKKVTKDIEYDDKKDRKEKKKDEVEENTVSGSVAPAAGGKASKGSGGMTFGKGVYESTIAESFNSKLKTVLNEGMSVNMSADQDGKKSLTVTATDEDAVKLSQLLNLAGVGGQSQGYGAVCPGCGSSDCGCDHVEEDLANSADNTEYADTDYMVNGLSGGLNGRKDTGQTVGAPINSQPARQGAMAESNDVVDLYKRIA